MRPGLWFPNNLFLQTCPCLRFIEFQEYYGTCYNPTTPIYSKRKRPAFPWERNSMGFVHFEENFVFPTETCVYETIAERFAIRDRLRSYGNLHSFAALTSGIFFLPLEQKIHIFSTPCNILHLFLSRIMWWRWNSFSYNARMTPATLAISITSD